MHTPPTTERASTTTTRFFILEAATAARWPEGPDPMTVRSYLTALMPGFSLQKLRCNSARWVAHGLYFRSVPQPRRAASMASAVPHFGGDAVRSDRRNKNAAP